MTEEVAAAADSAAADTTAAPSFAAYLNPVYPHSFPDPFVLKFRGEYFAYCTDFWRDGRVFGVLRSRDLVNWHEAGGAMMPLAENGPPFYWAPEVTYHNGKFYLYYSVGNETLMEIRVAVSDRPDGGFVDSGHRLTNEEFAIDAHVFEDADGARYLFYATDFLTHTHVGTGTVVDRMIDFFTLEGNPRPVTRARYDWQVYDPQRKEKGGVRWHTVEGSFVFKRKGVYYQMYSGGNWQNVTYGVSFAVTDDIRRDEEWTQFSDGEKVFPILRTVPGLIVGPGHNSAARGVNNRELFCVYHRWTENGRALAIDRMDFAGGSRMFVKGATHTPQPAPAAPHALDFFDELSAENWETISGSWKADGNRLISDGAAEKCEILCRRATAESFLCEVSLRAESEHADGSFGIALKNEAARDILNFSLAPAQKRVVVSYLNLNGELQTDALTLPENFDFRAFHLLRIEVDRLAATITLDENAARLETTLETEAARIALLSENAAAAFSGFALTVGFEDLFENSDSEKRGWRMMSESGECRVAARNLIVTGRGGQSGAILGREIPAGAEDYEFAVNVCLLETFGADFDFGFGPAVVVAAADEKTFAPFFNIEPSGQSWILKAGAAGETKRFSLPGSFSPDVFHQFRFLKIRNRITVQLETETVGEIEAPPTLPAASVRKIVLSARNVSVAFDMVRLTAL